MNKPSYKELSQRYEESLDTICSLQMEIRELKEERDDYIQAYEEFAAMLIEHEIL